MAKTMTSLEKDTLARNRIVTDIKDNFFVEAGAGSGKTTMLVNRMVAMVEAGIDIRKISAITFTKAAAGEFYDRFQKLLIERSNPSFTGEKENRAGMLPPPTEDSRTRCGEALQNLDHCFMGTIDAFCSMILSEHPTAAGIPSDAAIVSDDDVKAVYQQEFVRICDGMHGGDLMQLAKQFQSLHRKPREVFLKGMSLIMDNRNVDFSYEEAQNIDIDKAFSSERADLIKAVTCLMSHPELKYDGNKESRAAWDRISGIYRRVRGRWNNNIANVLYAIKNLKDLRLLPSALDQYAVSLQGLFEPGGKKGQWLEFTMGDMADTLKQLQYDISMTFLIKCAPILEDALREKGYLTFFDCLYYLRNMLKDDAAGDGKLIRYIYDRHSYFLIDEFQDTNPLQAEVFFYLTAENPVPQWSACVPRPGSLFIVGDPKQSIYRFRSADVTSFLNVKNLFETHGGAILSLSRNFRSTQMLCEYYNRAFTVLLPEETENQSKFEEIPLPEETKDEFQGIYSYKAYLGKGAADHPDMADPVMIADMIEGLVGNDALRIRDKRGEELRPIQFNDFMVITANKRLLGPIMEELDAREIPTRVEGSVPFARNEALCELSHIFAALADTEDTIALYGALCGKLIGLSREDILQFKALGGRVTLDTSFDKDSRQDDATNRVADEIERLQAMRLMALNLAPAALFAKLMEEFRIFQTVSSENMEVVYYSLELMRNAEKSGLIISLKDGAAFLNQLVSGKSEEERCLSLATDRDCVHIANLHKVKGLEAPIVILAAASARSNNSSQLRTIHGDTGSEGYLFYLQEEREDTWSSSSYFSTSQYADESLAEKEAIRAEGERLIYVAATRAKNALIICDSLKVSRGNESPDSKWNVLLTGELPDIFDTIGDPGDKDDEETITVDAANLYALAEEETVLKNRTAETSTFKLANPSRLYVRSKIAASSEIDENAQETEADSDEAQTDTPETNPHAALLGTMTHRLMEMLVVTKNGIDAESAVDEIIREYAVPSSKSVSKKLSATLMRVLDKIRGGGYAQENDSTNDILGTLLSADEVYCEVPFCYRDETEDQTLWTGIIDVIYRNKEQWHILDYKTNADGDDLDTRYQAQLDAYERAFKATTGLDADALTYHIDV